MITHDLTQGTPEWHAFRLTHFGASEAAAMLGLSSHTTRNELLHMKATASPKEFSDWVQRHILDYGHEVEALARPIAERILGADLYPVTVSDEGLHFGSSQHGVYYMSASLDGLTLAEDIAFEHKQMALDLAASVAQGILPDEHMPQCQQILMLTGAEYVLFVVSDGTEDNMVAMEVRPDLEWQGRIIAGWAQFAKDLVEYVPQHHPEKPAADPIMALPALSIYIKGEVTLSNLPEFKARAEEFIAGIKTDLQTDDDFANAEETVKFCDQAEKSLELAKTAALAQTVDIDVLMRTIDHIKDQLRTKRLALAKLVTDKKQSIRDGLLEKARRDFAAHVAALEAEIAPIRLMCQARDFAGAIRGKRTLATMHNAIDTEMAAGKISVDALAKAVRGRLSWYRAKAYGSDEGPGFQFLFPDLQNLIQKPDDDFKLAVQARINEHKTMEKPRAEPEPATVPAAVHQLPASAPREGQPTLRLGQIGERLGFALPAAFLTSLGFAGTKERGSVLYHEADFDLICRALVRHINAVQTKQAA